VKRTLLTAFAAGLATLAVAPVASADPDDVDSSKLRQAVTVEGILEHERALQNIADMNGGSRHSLTPGYTASVAYVKATMAKAGYNVREIQFNMPFWRENSPPLLQQTSPTAKTYRPGTAADDSSPNVDFITFEQSASGNLTNARVVPVNGIVIPSPGGTAAGCQASDFPAAISGAVALISRGTCPFVQKLDLAEAAGAIGVILFNEGDSAGRQNALFRSASPGFGIPAVHSSFAVGKELYDAYQAGQNPTVNLKVDASVVDRFLPQVVAESRRGDPNRVVISGAHLDSVTAGPGINDDGSGVSTQLEAAEQIAKLGTPPRYKLRFMFFGGEEDGLIGSNYYAANLSDAEASKVAVMLDYDMLASSNYARLVYDGDGNGEEGNPVGPPGSGEVENVFTRYFAERGMATQPIPFDGRSDYAGFINRGIPAGGIFAGAEAPKTAEQVALFGGVQGEQLDPCYHEDCDTYATLTGQPPASTMNTFATNPVLAQMQANSLNGNALKSLDEMSDAAVHAMWYFARIKNTLPPRATAARTAKTKSYRLARQGHSKRAARR
jgi:Zn-dependent M28 family amino/carboxypeptidase